MNSKYQCTILVLLLVISLQVQAQSPVGKFENLVFEGAGMRGLAYTGVITELDTMGILQDVKKVGGTSAGSIISLAIALGYTPEEITEIIYDTDFSSFNDGSIFSGVRRLKRNYGWYKGDKFTQWLEDLIASKTGNADITFKALHQQGYKDLYVVATSLNHQKNIVFSHETYPDMQVKHAIRASMSIPLYFQAVFVDKNGKVYHRQEANPDMDLMVDGGITGNFPIDIFDTDTLIRGRRFRVANPKTLGVRIDSDNQITYDRINQQLAPYDVQNVRDYIEAFYNYVVESLNRHDLNQDDWSRTISVSDAGIGPKIKNLSEEEKQSLIDSGREGVRAFFENNLAQTGEE